MFFPSKSFLVAVLAALLLPGCDQSKRIAESFVHSIPIAADIEKATGTKPQVFSYDEGTMLFVTVQFTEVPATPVQAIESIARAAAVRELKKDPTMLTISFMFNRLPG
jgi:PBP1b-binding outer membrane lipoprotein LpoB